MGKKIKVGDKVVIYHDPVGKLNREGVAELVQCLKPATKANPFSRWSVLFDGDDCLYERCVYEGGKKAS